MKPKSSIFSEKKKRQRKRMLKTFTSSVAISTILLGGAKLTTPTYGEFNSPQDQDLEVQACFIFPKAVEEYRDRTYELKQEVQAVIDEALAKVSELNVSAMTEKLDSLTETEGEENAESPDVQIDTSTIEGLQALQGYLQAEIGSIQSTIAANEQQMIVLQDVITELEELITQLEDVVANIFPYAKEQSQQKLDEMMKIILFIEELKGRAIEECDYDPQFFIEILKQMNFYRTDTELLLQQLDEELTNTQDQIEQFNDNVTELTDTITSLQTANDNLASQISELESLIASIGQQIKELEEQKRLEEERKKKEELAKLEEEEKKKQEELAKLEEEKKKQEEQAKLEEEKKKQEETDKQANENSQQEEKNEGSSQELVNEEAPQG